MPEKADQLYFLLQDALGCISIIQLPPVSQSFAGDLSIHDSTSQYYQQHTLSLTPDLTWNIPPMPNLRFSAKHFEVLLSVYKHIFSQGWSLLHWPIQTIPLVSVPKKWFFALLVFLSWWDPSSLTVLKLLIWRLQSVLKPLLPYLMSSLRFLDKWNTITTSVQRVISLFAHFFPRHISSAKKFPWTANKSAYFPQQMKFFL